MSFWSWMRKFYLQWTKRSLNFAMFMIGMGGGFISFVAGLAFMEAGSQWGLVLLCLSGVGFVLGNYGWYRSFVRATRPSSEVKTQ